MPRPRAGRRRLLSSFASRAAGLHFAEQVQVIIAGGAVAAQRHADAPGPAAGHGTGAEASFMLGLRAVHHVGAGGRQQGDILVAQVGHVHALGAGPQQAQPVQAVQWSLAVLLNRQQHLSPVSCR